MPFEIRIWEWQNTDRGAIDLGQFPDAVTTYSDSNTAETADFIEFIYQNKLKAYRVIKTIIHSDVEENAFCFLQSLEEYPINHFENNLYLKGALVDEKPKKVTLYTSENDNKPKQIFMPIIPRTNHDYIKVEDICYRCDKIKFTKEGVVIIANAQNCTFSEFEGNFFSRILV